MLFIMSEYEWEARRVPRTNRPEPWSAYRPRAREVAEFLALEHPREHVAWVLKLHAQKLPTTVKPERPPASKPRTPAPITPLDRAGVRSARLGRGTLLRPGPVLFAREMAGRATSRDSSECCRIRSGDRSARSPS